MEVEHRELLDFERKAICNSIMNCLVSKVTHLRPYDYNFIFNEIVAMFPFEMKGLYYMAPYSYEDDQDGVESEEERMEPKQKKRKQVLAKGQLLTSFRYRIEKYRTERRLLEEAGCSNRMLKNTKAHQELNDSQPILQDLKAWLSENFEPWEVVEEKWSKTCSIRSIDIERSKDFNKLLTEWPRYTRKIAYTLIDIDFNYSLPGKNLFKSAWPKYRKTIIKLALGNYNANNKTFLHIIYYNIFILKF